MTKQMTRLVIAGTVIVVTLAGVAVSARTGEVGPMFVAAVASGLLMFSLAFLAADD